ncbi:unnamed protein product [Debaryomyces tyrocola]|nr:unnamed protein product [Debaryomyces tyrocola]
MSSAGGKALTICLVAGLSWYTGVKFWQPLIIDRLQQDGNLRDDVYIRDTSDQPKSWSDLKEKVKTTLHPNDPSIGKEELIKDFNKEKQETIDSSK